ncbi:hypothetical protein SORBI_3005G092700 [Sorghum bicolor]|uniref:Protein kinase domain-containing protein n=1 Tax=Sorghum bicolor TaxID=4558 RepID=A0A1B6PR77_SORBI|nr:hypothetical protein SORBI_3005G092700 [Sorghum bicolor]
MAWHLSILVMVTTCLSLFSISEQSSQTELLQQLRKQLEYPRQLDAWGSPSSDPCSTKPTAVLAVTCEGNAIRELKIIGDRITKAPKFSGFSVPNVTLSEAFVLDSFVTTLTRLTTLRVVILVSLGLWGPIPDKIHRLASLEMPTSVVTILLSKNSLKGEIPEQFGQLNRLQHLDVSFNFLVGSPPAELFALPNISYLNLAANMLSGSLLSSLTCSSTLGFVDLSTNRLTGDLPSCLNGNLNNKVVKFDGNCFSVDPAHQHEAKYCQQSHKGKGSNKDVGLVVTVVGILFVMLVLSLLLMASNKRSCQKVLAEKQFQQKHTQDNSISGMSSELLVNARCISQAVKLGTQVQPSHRIFSLEELKEATKSFERSAFLGEGAIGKLYKGKLENGTLIAIRCLALHQRYSIRNLKLRLDLLAKLRHPNLVCLLGHCIDSAVDESTVKRVFLVYEYVPGGTLSSYLSASSPEKTLKWCDRLQVLIAIAKAVHFLHTGIIPGSLSNRLKSSSILVDEHHMAKLSDYGLSIITEEIYKHEVIGQKKKYFQNDPTEMENLEDDVCSFGFILLEVLMGPKLHEKGDPFILKDLVASMSTLEERDQVVDPVVIGTSSQDSLSIVVSIMIKCLSVECSVRPSIEEVLWNLQYSAQVQTAADGDQRSEVSSQAS